MSIVSVEVTEDVTVGTQRTIRFLLTDHLGNKYKRGPMWTVDPSFDLDAYKVLLAAKWEAMLAAQEIDEVLA